MNSPAQDFYIHDSWCGLFDHICDEVVFIPGAFRFKGRSTLSSGKNKFKTLFGCQSSSVFSVFLLLYVQKRHSTESQACQDGFDQRRIAAVPTAVSFPVQRGLSDQACRSLCFALAKRYNRGQVADCHCLLCQRVKSTVLTPTISP